MTENRRYYYLKLKEYFFNSETMMILESMQDGLQYPGAGQRSGTNDTPANM